MSTKDAPVSQENKMVARHAASAFGGTARVDEYINDSDTLAIGILYCRDQPAPGATSWSTVKLSDRPMGCSESGRPFGIELAGMCSSNVRFFGNVLASAAFTILQDDAMYERGTVMPDAVRQHFPGSNLPHLWLTDPLPWNPALRELDCGSKKVRWLLAVPISESERRFLNDNGAEALGRLFAESYVDIADLTRASTT